MYKTYAFALICLAFVLVGCASEPLYVTKSGVSIYLVEEPEVEEESFKIKFYFESPTDDRHVIQRIDSDGWTGIEAFRTNRRSTGTDTHSILRKVVNVRKMTLIPGEVVDVDESLFGGFSMLPSGWPLYWNAKFRLNHKIQGTILMMRPEFQTIYHLEFIRGKLVWTVEGTAIRREWNMPKQ